jgi:hypothetical protein
MVQTGLLKTVQTGLLKMVQTGLLKMVQTGLLKMVQTGLLKSKEAAGQIRNPTRHFIPKLTKPHSLFFFFRS